MSGFTAKVFTLVELLVVLAIIGILSSLLLPALGKARENASAICCAGQMKQLGVATQNYVDTYDGYLPLANAFTATDSYNWINGLALMTSDQGGWNWGWKIGTPQSTLKLFQCPSGNDQLQWGVNLLYNRRAGGNVMNAGLGNSYRPRKLHLLSCASEVLILGDGLDKSMVNNTFDYNTGQFHFRHGGKANLLMADSHVETMTLPQMQTSMTVPDWTIIWLIQ